MRARTKGAVVWRLSSKCNLFSLSLFKSYSIAGVRRVQLELLTWQFLHFACEDGEGGLWLTKTAPQEGLRTVILPVHKAGICSLSLSVV